MENSVKGGNKVSLKGIGFFFIRSQAEEALHAQIAKGKPNLAPLQSPDLLDDAELLAEDREMDAELTGTDTLSLSLLFFWFEVVVVSFHWKRSERKKENEFSTGPPPSLGHRRLQFKFVQPKNKNKGTILMPSHGNDSQHENCATSRLEISRNDSEIKWKDRLLLGLTTFGSAQRCRTLIGHWWATSQSGVGNVEFLLAQPIFFFWGRRSWGLGSKKKEKERKKKKKKSEENSDSFDPSLFNRIGCNRWRRAPPPKEMSCQSDTDTHTHETGE